MLPAMMAGLQMPMLLVIAAHLALHGGNLPLAARRQQKSGEEMYFYLFLEKFPPPPPHFLLLLNANKQISNNLYM